MSCSAYAGGNCCRDEVPNYGNIPQRILDQQSILDQRFFGDGREEENWKIITKK